MRKERFNREQIALELHKDIVIRKIKVDNAIANTQVPETKEKPNLKPAGGKKQHSTNMNIPEIVRLIKLGMDEEGVSLCKMATDTGINKGQISKLLNGHNHNPSFMFIVRLMEYLKYWQISLLK